MAVQPPADQEPREARRQEEQGTYVPLRLGTETLQLRGGVSAFSTCEEEF